MRPRAWLQLRWLMALVAVAALALGVKVGRDRRRAFQARAFMNEILATRSYDVVDLEAEPGETIDHYLRRLRDRPPEPRRAALRVHYRNLQEKYEAAVDRPWLPVPPDPPAPD